MDEGDSHSVEKRETDQVKGSGITAGIRMALSRGNELFTEAALENTLERVTVVLVVFGVLS